MIIKKLRIKNFRSYYDVNEFILSDRLTLIIGDNGDGKSTLFGALQWLLNTSRLDNDNSIDHVSEILIRKSSLKRYMQRKKDTKKPVLIFCISGQLISAETEKAVRSVSRFCWMYPILS
jgi:DNA repair exonuclease SbcCD ATPase subunit